MTFEGTSLMEPNDNIVFVRQGDDCPIPSRRLNDFESSSGSPPHLPPSPPSPPPLPSPPSPTPSSSPPPLVIETKFLNKTSINTIFTSTGVFEVCYQRENENYEKLSHITVNVANIPPSPPQLPPSSPPPLPHSSPPSPFTITSFTPSDIYTRKDCYPISTNCFISSDRSYRFTTVPTELSGATYFENCCHKSGLNGLTFSFTFNRPATVYVCVETAGAQRDCGFPSSITSSAYGFTDTGFHIYSQTSTFRCYQKTVHSGQITLPRTGDTDNDCVHAIAAHELPP